MSRALILPRWIFSALLIIALASLFPGPVARSQSQPPINLIFDMHADPLPQSPYPDKVQYYQMQLDNGNWVLDQTEPLGVKISFLACGEFMEFVVQDGPGGPGSLFLERIYLSGGQIASHSHREYRQAAFDWPSFPQNATYAQSMTSWADNIDWVNSAILMALGSPPPDPLSKINAVKGAHLPPTEEEYHDLMAHFGLKVREGGAEEDYYGLYNHYIMNPFRPSADNYMGEDLSAPFVVVPQGAVIGKAGIHHGIFQDMTAPNVKRMFIQTYLNWRYRDRHGLMEKVWSFGWGSHNHDYQPGSQTCTDMKEMINWLDANFVDKADATGSVIAKWNTQKGAADEYFAWEAAHPGTSSFDSNGTHLDWRDYPYLRAVCFELWEAHHVQDLDLGPGIKAWHLTKGSQNIVVLFSDAGPIVKDLSSLVSNPCRTVAAETGILLGTDPAQVPVDSEPVIVTEAAPSITMTGVPAIGQPVAFHVHGTPNEEGYIYFSLGQGSFVIPHIGKLLIDIGSGFNLLGHGPMTSGTYTLPLVIPNNPSLVGFTFYLQGLEVSAIGMTLTVNALDVTLSQ